MLKYGLVGLSGLAVEWLFFFLFRDGLGIVYWAAHAMGSFLAICNNYVLNYYFTFKARNRFLKRAAVFFAVGLTGIAIGTALLPLGVSLIKSYGGGLIDVADPGNEKIIENISKLGVTGIVVFVQFFINKFVTFRQKEEEEA